MADRYLLESGAPDGYLLEDSSGVLLLEDMAPFVNRYPTFVNKRVQVYDDTSASSFAALREVAAEVQTRGAIVVNNNRVKRDVGEIQFNNLLETTLADNTPAQEYIATSYPEFFPIQRKNNSLTPYQYPNLNVTTLAATQAPFVNQYVVVPHRLRNLATDTLSAFAVVRALAGISGSANVTNANDTVVASGTTTVVGSLASTNSNDTVSATGTTTVTGTLATTNSDDTVSASGTVGSAVTGSANVTEQPDTSSASGTTTVTGSANVTNADDTSAASGTTTVTGTLSKTNNNDTVSAFGVVGTPSSVTSYLPLTGVGR
jgi:hypothetical protein